MHFAVDVDDDLAALKSLDKPLLKPSLESTVDGPLHYDESGSGVIIDTDCSAGFLEHVGESRREPRLSSELSEQSRSNFATKCLSGQQHAVADTETR